MSISRFRDRRKIKKVKKAILELDVEEVLRLRPDAEKVITDKRSALIGLHKVRLSMEEATEAQKRESRQWLEARGLSIHIRREKP